MERRYIKVNLPLTKADFQSGNGEGVFVIVDKKTTSDYDKDAEGGTYTGILDNGSYYQPYLRMQHCLRNERRKPPCCSVRYVLDEIRQHHRGRITKHS